MTPLSNIISERSQTLSLDEILKRVENKSNDTIVYQRNKINERQTSTIKMEQIKQALLDMRQQIDIIVSALEEDMPNTKIQEIQHDSNSNTHTFSYSTPQFSETAFEKKIEPIQSHNKRSLSKSKYQNGSEIIEGKFTGNKMAGNDGRLYDVSENYASKSKLVEGDLLKLTITNGGKFFYKQIGQVRRKNIVGELSQDPQGNWVVISNMIPYRVLTASVTFHKARQGDRVVIIVPEEGNPSWGTVEIFLK